MKSFRGKLLVLFIFGFLPAVSLYLVAHRLIDQKRQADFAEARSGLRQKLIQIADTSSPAGFYFRLVERLLNKMADKTISSADSARLIAQAQSFCGQNFAVYLFDKTGTLQTLPGYAPPNRFVVSKLWDILAETPEYRKGDELRQLKRLQILLGAEASAGVIKNHEGQLLSLKKKRAGGYLYWKRNSADSLSGALIIVFPVYKTHEILNRLFRQKTNDDLHLVFWSHDHEYPLFIRGALQNHNYLRGKIEQSSSECLLEAGRMWLALKTSHGVFLGSLTEPGLSDHGQVGMINLLFAIILAILMLLLFNSSFDLSRIYLRTGSKLMALLLIAIAIPTAGLLMTGIIAISTHEKVLWSRFEKEQLTRLSAIEDDFAEEERSFGRHCEYLRDLVLKNYTSAGYEKVAGSMIDSGQAIRVQLFGLDGETLSLFNAGSWFEGLEKSVDAYGRYLIAKHLAPRSSAEQIAIKRKPDPVLNDVFASPDFGFGQITEAPGKVHSTRFGMNELMWYWHYIDVPGHPAAVLHIFHARNLARRSFLKRVVKEHSSTHEVIAVFDSARQSWLGSTMEPGDDADALVRAAILTDRPEQRRIKAAGRNWLALAYSGQVLDPYSMVMFIDERLVSERIDLLYRLLALAIIVIFAVALMIARVLTDTFLGPVTELDRGMMLVQQRSREAKVAIDAGDEFGELGEAFNRMVDELNEMQLAKEVQEALFPQEKLEIPGFDTAIFNMAATDLGGDYCDYVKLDACHYLFLIGDVSGHGTSAALCMAMVKAAVFKACRDGLDFIELPAKISSLLLKTLSRKRMMTMLFMLLNTDDCSLNLINAGHNWPIIVRRDGSIEEIPLAGIPLGAREIKKRPDNRQVLLETGDMIFTYTDALVEVQSPGGEVYGHEALYAELAKLSGLSPAETLEHIKSAWNSFLGGGIQQDDLTMLVMKNVSKEPANVA